MTTATQDFGTHAPSATQRFIISLARGSFLHRGFWRPMISRLLVWLRPGPIDVMFRGLPFRLTLGHNIVSSAMVLWPSYNGAEIDGLKSALPVGATFIDIGANVGLYTLALAQHVGAQGRVFAIEPAPAAVKTLWENIALAGLSNVTLIEAACGPKNTDVPFTLHPADDGGNRVAFHANEATLTVAQKTLLSVFQEHNITKPCALKIDIEGYEDEVLVPFFESAPQSLWPDFIVMEYCRGWHWNSDLLGLLQTLGYNETLRTRNNRMFALSTKLGSK